ncbi:YqgE/AlgH family protein [Thalassobaculum sp.]|uniref:YqgE/AlgH family protein n=1 Tax=Thalassobaculum sp. TaxID=2022740 RepID=UPI0032EE1243
MTLEDSEKDGEGYLTGQILIAMPSMSDPRFARSVIFLCAHNAEGAMGLVLNRLLDSITFKDLLEELKVEEEPLAEESAPAIHFGGPVETGRGFVLHSVDYVGPDSMPLSGTFALTATVDILKAIAAGNGPQRHLLALGYAGWGPGQLDGELQENAWLSVDADPELVFSVDLTEKWDRALAKLGIDVSLLSSDAGHA